jgi:hypothetical protein
MPWLPRPAIRNLLQALNEVEEAHYRMPNVRVIEDVINIYDDRFTTYENNFTSQLHMHYAMLARLGEIREPRPFLRQLQIPKHYAWSKDADEHVREALEKLRGIHDSEEDMIDQLLTIPDFIIHKEQENMDMENQLLIAEVKTEANLPYAKFAWDLFKLNLYLNKFNFQTACFIVTGNQAKKIRSFVFRYLKEEHYLTDRTKDLFIIIKENHSNRPVTYSLRRYQANVSPDPFRRTGPGQR